MKRDLHWDEASEPRSMAERLDIVRRYGSFTMAYSSLQQGLQYFDVPSGFIAYERKWGVHLVLADPVAPQWAHASLVDRFLEAHRRAVFCHLSAETAALLQDRGFYVNEMGVDVEIDLEEYDFAGRKKAKLRQAGRQLARRGYRVEERCAGQVDWEEVRAVSSGWRSTRVRSRRELRFLTRPIQFEDEVDVRKFYLFDPDGKIAAFVFLDPMYEQGEVVGYSTAIKRRLSSAPVGAEEGVMKHVIEKLQGQGYRRLSLGLVPLFEIQNDCFRANWFLHHAARLYYRYGNWIFNFQGHADFKRRFRGTHHKVYFATRSVENTLPLLALLRVCRAI